MIGSRFWSQEEQPRVASEFRHPVNQNAHLTPLGAVGSLMGCLQAFESSLSSAYLETPRTFSSDSHIVPALEQVLTTPLPL